MNSKLKLLNISHICPLKELKSKLSYLYSWAAKTKICNLLLQRLYYGIFNILLHTNSLIGCCYFDIYEHSVVSFWKWYAQMNVNFKIHELHLKVS